jgi:hypothetical protein
VFHKLVTATLGQPFTLLDVDEPSLVRINRTLNGGATIFAPTTGGAISLAAWPVEEQPPGATQGERFSSAWRGSGPLLYIPRRGRWAVAFQQTGLGGALLPNPTALELSVIAMPPAVAASYLTAPPASYQVSGYFNALAGTTFNVFSASGIDLSALNTGPAYWHSLVRFAIQLNETPATDFYVNIARTAGPAHPGGALGGLSRRVFEWPEIAGSTIFVRNTSANDYDCWIEAHFL